MAEPDDSRQDRKNAKGKRSDTSTFTLTLAAWRSWRENSSCEVRSSTAREPSMKAIGLRIKSGFAIAAIVSKSAEVCTIEAVRKVALSTEDLPQSRFPYHPT